MAAAGSFLRAAAIDVGANSVRLLVADVKGKEKIIPLYRDLRTTRLGEGWKEIFILRPEARERTTAVLKDFKQIAFAYGAEKILAAATSAVREAHNKEEFLNEVKERTGLEIKTLSGEEEAFLSYTGVQKGLGGFRQVGLPLVVVDVGGGSTEFTYLLPDGKVYTRSYPVGAVWGTEKEITTQEVLSLFGPTCEGIKKQRPFQLVGVGGTVTTLVAVEKGLVPYNPEKVHGARLTKGEITEIRNYLAGLSLPERRKVPGLQPERAEIILAGILILEAVLEGLAEEEITVSESDLLEGLLFSSL